MSKVNSVVKNLTEKYKNAGVRSLTNNPIVVQTISTGSMQLDRATGINGIPRGYITEIFGAPAGGKTSLSYSIMKSAQQQGLRVAYVDAEFAFNPRWAMQQGIDIDDEKFIFARPEVGEDAIDLVEDLARNAEEYNLGVIVVDSVGALTPRRELAAESVEDQFIGGRAKLMTQACVRLKAPIEQANVALIFINHMKEKVGVVYGDPRIRPGGKALDFYSSLMLEVRKGEKLMQGEEVIGTTIKVVPYKNKFTAFGKSDFTEVQIMTNGGVNPIYDMLQLAIELGVVKKAGAWIKYRDENIGQGVDKACANIEADPALRQRIQQDIDSTP